MTPDQITTSIGTLGFPIAVTLYLLWERRTTTTQLTTAVQNNTTALKLLTAKIK